MNLPATILAIWSVLAPGAERMETAKPIAAAIAAASGGDERLAAILAVYTFRESSLRPGVTGDGGASCGMLQMRCELVRGLSLEQQAATWIRLVQASSLGSVDSSPSRAAKRVRLAERLLERVTRGDERTSRL